MLTQNITHPFSLSKLLQFFSCFLCPLFHLEHSHSMFLPAQSQTIVCAELILPRAVQGVLGAVWTL